MENNVSSNSLRNGNGAGDMSSGKAAAGVHNAVDKVATAAGAAVEKVLPAIERISDAAHSTVDKVAGAAEPAADWIKEQGEWLKTRQQKAAEETERYVAANPWKAVGLALAAGFLLSRLLR